MEHHEIVISVENGKLEYSCPSRGLENARSLLVMKDDTVTWTCEFGDYAIQFANNASPFHEESPSLSKPGRTPTDLCHVKPPRFRWEPFKYTVAVHSSGASPSVLVDDPIIIVDDG